MLCEKQQSMDSSIRIKKVCRERLTCLSIVMTKGISKNKKQIALFKELTAFLRKQVFYFILRLLCKYLSGMRGFHSTNLLLVSGSTFIRGFYQSIAPYFY